MDISLFLLLTIGLLTSGMVMGVSQAVTIAVRHRQTKDRRHHE